MLYVAHVGIQLKNITTTAEKDRWHIIKTVNNIEYRWKINKDLLYEVLAGVFTDRVEALKCAKQIYVTLLFSLLRGRIRVAESACESYAPRFYHLSEWAECSTCFYPNDECFEGTKQLTNGQLGLGVFEVDNSIDEFDKYFFLQIEMSSSYDSNLNFDNVDEYMFLYNKEAQELFSNILLAENTQDYGMRILIYCSILESITDNSLKSPKIISILDDFIHELDNLEISNDEKSQLKNLLNNGKNMSSRQKCKELVKKYGKSHYGDYPAKKIIDDAYSVRSTYSHGKRYHNVKETTKYMRYVVLDVILNYMQKKEQPNLE
ncbi:MAG: hypothetical protein IJY70_01015 [Clostridia bacterium]|nr:hypothetical protein [Clostridia bacterium]